MQNSLLAGSSRPPLGYGFPCGMACLRVEPVAATTSAFPSLCVWDLSLSLSGTSPAGIFRVSPPSASSRERTGDNTSDPLWSTFFYTTNHPTPEYAAHSMTYATNVHALYCCVSQQYFFMTLSRLTRTRVTGIDIKIPLLGKQELQQQLCTVSPAKCCLNCSQPTLVRRGMLAVVQL